jgi:hypothetical protein
MKVSLNRLASAGGGAPPENDRRTSRAPEVVAAASCATPLALAATGVLMPLFAFLPKRAAAARMTARSVDGRELRTPANF